MLQTIKKGIGQALSDLGYMFEGTPFVALALIGEVLKY